MGTATAATNHAAPSGAETCQTCGANIKADWRYCPYCRGALAPEADSTESPPVSPGHSDYVPLARSGSPQRTVSRRRRRRRWYKRPVIIIPLAILVLLTVAGGLAAYRTMSAFDRVQSISTPPPEVDVAVEDGGAERVIDTGPAQQALREHEAAEARAGDTVAHNEAALPTGPGDQAGGLEPTTEVEHPMGVATTEAETSLALAEPTPDAGNAPGNTTANVTEPAVTASGTVPSPQGSSGPQDSVSAELPESAPIVDVGTGSADGSMNVLLMGVDARDGEAIDVGVRPDSLAILNLNEGDGTCRILAVPRDSRVDVPGYGQSKVNHALAVGGIPFERLVVEQYLGIEIDHYALVDFSGLVAVVDAVGGITIDNPDAFQVGDQAFAAGEIELNGEQALLYARYRGGPGGDFGRVANQQRILRALLDEANNANLVGLAPEMFTLLQDHFRTDFGVTGLLDLANTYRDRCTSGTLETRTIPGDVATMYDDMMQMNLSFVVSAPGDVAAHVAWLLHGALDEAPAASSSASPVSTPPSSTATPTLRRSGQRAQVP